jgi:hypothetical protein
MYSNERKLSPLLFICLPFFFIESFSLSRQILAISFLILGYSYSLSYKFNKSSVLYILAAGIHITSLFFFLILFIWKNYNPKNRYYILFVMAVFGFIFTSVSSNDLLSRGLFYLSTDDNSSGFFYIFISLLLLVYAVLCDKELFYVAFFAFLYAIYVYMFLTYPFNRFLFYFYIIFLFCKISKKQTLNEILGQAILVVIFTITLYIKIRDEGNNLIPFNTIFAGF